MIFFATGLGAVVANFLWQAVGGHDWSLAIDRSWFQVCALGAAWLTTALRLRALSSTQRESE